MEPNYNMTNGPMPMMTPAPGGNTGKGKWMLYAVIVLAILAIGGIGFGIWAMVDGNTQKAQLNAQIDALNARITELGGDEEPVSTGYFYGKPESAEEIESIFISYNEGKDNIDILDGEIRYYAFDEEGNTTDENSRVLETDTSGIKQYVFENDLEYLESYYSEEDFNWSIVVNGAGMGCTKYGNGEYPDWFKALLDELKVDEYGYLYK